MCVFFLDILTPKELKIRKGPQTMGPKNPNIAPLLRSELLLARKRAAIRLNLLEFAPFYLDLGPKSLKIPQNSLKKPFFSPNSMILAAK